MVIAFALIVIGVLFLLRNTHLLPDPAWDVVWPLVLIVLGAAVFFQKGTHMRGLCFPGCPCVTSAERGRRTNGNGK